MLDFIRGKLVSLKLGLAIVDTGALGYRIHVPLNSLGLFPTPGEVVILYVSVVTRETDQQVYGFLSSEERQVFEILITISGVGPKTALALLSYLSLQQLEEAITAENDAILAKVPGIGKKTAQRLLLELKDKLPNSSHSTMSQGGLTASLNPNEATIKDAMSVLINLGYNQQTAQQAIKKALKNLPESPDLTLVITHALREI
ncbi:MAG: ruvA [Chlamydiales bacterium]|jgi:Holliday junction DNA helicase RuvA|nr:ruvA [Chlamydiales bacterium]